MAKRFDALLAELGKKEEGKQYIHILRHKERSSVPLTLAGRAADAIIQLMEENAELSAPKKSAKK